MLDVSVTPDGKIFLAPDKDRLVSFQSGFSNVVLSDVGVDAVSCSPSGAVYVAAHSGVHKLVGDMLRPVISNEHLCEELQFLASEFFATDEGVVTGLSTFRTITAPASCASSQVTWNLQ